jgi:hypothetical protein
MVNPISSYDSLCNAKTELIHRRPGDKVKRRLILAYLIILLFHSAGAAYAADARTLIEFRDNGTIDWTKGVVTARGIVDPTTYGYYNKSQGQRQQSIDEAINKSRHNLLETIVGIRINSEIRVIDIVENSPPMMYQLKGMTYRAPEVDSLRRYLYDGTVEVWSRMKLNGGFTQLILPPEIRQIESIKQVGPGKNSSRLRSGSQYSQIYTGMVVDARGIQAIPVIAPRIFDENLEEVFGPNYASREFAVQQGVARYTTNIWQAKFDLRVSENPIVVKALKTIWPGRCDFIISNTDADKLRSASEHLLFLRECKVIIVLDSM